MPMKSMAVQILAGSMACVCHTVITVLKVAMFVAFFSVSPCLLMFNNV